MTGGLCVLQPPKLKCLGELSFPIYMCHYIFIQWWWKIADFYSLDRESFLGAIICFLEALIFAILYKKFFDPKIVTLLLKK